MAKRLSVDERKLIDQLGEQGFKSHEIGAQIGRDTRTVKLYLSECPRKRSVELERQQQELDHRNDLRNRIKNLERELEFPPPAQLDITDLSTGARASFVTMDSIVRWQQADGGSYILKLADEFSPIMEHIRSSRRKAILDVLKEWQRIGGKCIVDCHRLMVDIQKEAERQTKLSTVPENIVEGNVVRSNAVEGLLKEFSWTIYRWSLCNDKEEDYTVENRINDLWVLRWGMHNLARVTNDEVERIKDIHRRLIRNYRKVSTTLDILEGKKKLDVLAESACRKLDEFAGLSKLPGKCRLCPSD